MKTPEELNALKNQVEALSAKLAQLTDDEMKQVTGGTSFELTLPHKADCMSEAEIRGVEDKFLPGTIDYA